MPIMIAGTRGILNAKTRTTGMMGLMRAMARTFFSPPAFAAGIAQALRTLPPGSGIVALLAASGMNPVAAMVALRLDSNVQAVCDPTNSHNVWVSDFTKVDVNEYLKKVGIFRFASTS